MAYGSLPLRSGHQLVARIAAEILLDDSLEQQRHFDIEPELNGQTTTIIIAADKFRRMGLVLRHLGISLRVSTRADRASPGAPHPAGHVAEPSPLVKGTETAVSKLARVHADYLV
jgi:hypothetical protein